MTFTELVSKLSSLEADIRAIRDTLANIQGTPNIRAYSHASLLLNDNLDVIDLLRRINALEERMRD